MPTILVIDDDHSIRHAIQALLRKNGYEVVLASDGAAGLKLIGSARFDAVIVDMFMDGMDGLATIRELKKCDPKMPFVAMSGFPFTDPRNSVPDFLGMAVRLGAVAALQKPCRVFELLNAVQKCIAARERDSESEGDHEDMVEMAPDFERPRRTS
ncbi:response regulator [Bradyrhizobium sp.]|uniref:response regulator n=1 Tax=Bradyrhizobium sp. TaxID=376 RepID=UPI001D895C01|nr:response regulator [Bradyrhizobium sp.]MBV8696338.1 response regulator [Bradyrhizobium sp.]MBV8918830.1 response regulator [Bradyrhizobium sp.]MBV9979249.1 response regulator [Bradyrhizobium sp.]